MNEKQEALVVIIASAGEDLGRLKDAWSAACTHLGQARHDHTQAEERVHQAEKYLEKNVYALVDSITQKEKP